MPSAAPHIGKLKKKSSFILTIFFFCLGLWPFHRAVHHQRPPAGRGMQGLALEAAKRRAVGQEGASRDSCRQAQLRPARFHLVLHSAEPQTRVVQLALPADTCKGLDAHVRIRERSHTRGLRRRSCVVPFINRKQQASGSACSLRRPGSAAVALACCVRTCSIRFMPLSRGLSPSYPFIPLLSFFFFSPSPPLPHSRPRQQLLAPPSYPSILSTLPGLSLHPLCFAGAADPGNRIPTPSTLRPSRGER